MSYSIKEIYYTLQGEGVHTGRPAVFVRFSGCNLWSGREEDRAMAICRFCDTDFVGTDGPGGATFASAEALARRARALWPDDPNSHPFVVCTGGEPLLQLDQTLVDAFHTAGFEVAVETNGTLEPPERIDWICVSPKSGAELVLKEGNELKLVFPQANMDPQDFLRHRFDHFLLQPLYGPEVAKNTLQAVQYCLEHPQWRLSLQIHRFLNIP
ncbi:MAG: 7-carboxy-7-deazaguanine synthase [Dehalococcoidia bacterium]|nr:7-carboxy-7-deazaguanine synthase [Dehalococcoidia bacterium]